MVTGSQGSGATILDAMLWVAILHGKASMEIFGTLVAGLILLVALPSQISWVKSAKWLKQTGGDSWTDDDEDGMTFVLAGRPRDHLQPNSTMNSARDEPLTRISRVPRPARSPEASSRRCHGARPRSRRWECRGGSDDAGSGADPGLPHQS